MRQTVTYKMQKGGCGILHNRLSASLQNIILPLQYLFSSP